MKTTTNPTVPAGLLMVAAQIMCQRNHLGPGSDMFESRVWRLGDLREACNLALDLNVVMGEEISKREGGKK